MSGPGETPDDYAIIRQDLARSYDTDATRRDAMTPDAWRTGLIDGFATELRSRGLTRVIELGAGTGQLAAHLATSGFDVTATDLSEHNVAAIRARDLPASLIDFSEIPPTVGQFDAAFAMNALLHVPKADLARVVTGVRPIIRSGGLFLIVVWGGRTHEGPIESEWLTPPRYFSFFTDDDFAALEFSGFATLENRYLTPITEDRTDVHPQVKLLLAE